MHLATGHDIFDVFQKKQGTCEGNVRHRLKQKQIAQMTVLTSVNRFVACKLSLPFQSLTHLATHDFRQPLSVTGKKVKT